MSGSPAYDLLLACAVWDPSETRLNAVRAQLNADIDWSEWLRLVRAHRLVPHAQRALGAVRAISPADVAEALMKDTVTIAARSLARTEQLGAALHALNGDGIRALPFMGPALSLAAYGEFGVRDSGGLDIVVCKPDIDRARELLRRVGGTSPVEVHSRFAVPRYTWSIAAEDVFARAIAIDLAGAQVASPDATDHLLFQLMHGARHQWERLEWLVAFAQLLERSRQSEEVLVKRAEANGASRALSLALRLAHDVLGASLSPRLSELAGDERTSARAAQITAAIEAATFSSDSVRQPPGFSARVRGALHRLKSLFVRR